MRLSPYYLNQRLTRINKELTEISDEYQYLAERHNNSDYIDASVYIQGASHAITLAKAKGRNK